MSRWDRVLCLEGAWQSRLRDRSSVLPMLELLERLKVIDFVHRDVGTHAELEHYLQRWLEDRSVRDFLVLYLAFHGSSAGLDVGGNPFSLARLAAVLEGELADCVIHFGSCSVLSQPPAVLDRFLATTGARAVTGYSSDVDWLDSAALDLVVLGALAKSDDVGDAIARMHEPRYASLAKHLKFKTHPRFQR